MNVFKYFEETVIGRCADALQFLVDERHILGQTQKYCVFCFVLM